jgi:hypothetical protein
LLLLGVLPISTLISRLPISFDGLGVYEAVIRGFAGAGGNRRGCGAGDRDQRPHHSAVRIPAVVDHVRGALGRRASAGSFEGVTDQLK